MEMNYTTWKFWLFGGKDKKKHFIIASISKLFEKLISLVALATPLEVNESFIFSIIFFIFCKEDKGSIVYNSFYLFFLLLLLGLS